MNEPTLQPEQSRSADPVPTWAATILFSGALPVDEIICGDNCDVLGTFPRDCIDLVVTSPPYDDLRTYGGHEWDFYGVAWQLKRVLKPGGVIVWVVADQTKDGSETGSSADQAAHFRRLGLRQHDTMVYAKHAVGACGSQNGYAQAWEYAFVFAAGKPRTFNPIADVKNANGGLPRKFAPKSERLGTRTHRDVKVAELGKRTNVWTYHAGICSQDDRTKHPAQFPEGLATDHIRSWSKEGDIGLEPFNGSGTTCKAARELGRRFIGIDVNPEYCELARQRIAQKLLWT